MVQLLHVLCLTLSASGVLVEAQSEGVNDHDVMSLLQTNAVKADNHTDDHPFYDTDDGCNWMADECDPASVSSHRGIMMRYHEKKNTAICACAKCGSTSLWEWVFANEFGHSFSDDSFHQAEKDSSVQDVYKTPWHGAFTTVISEKGQASLFRTAFTFALVRDPKERLVSSWKSKVACGKSEKLTRMGKSEAYGTDLVARKKLVEQLLELWNGPSFSNLLHSSCLQLGEFATVLRDIHNNGKGHLLNAHFLPQSLGCFARHPPQDFSLVTDIAGDDPFSVIADQMKLEGEIAHSHASVSPTLITQEVDDFLTEVTKPDYVMLGDYLHRPSKVMAGAMV